MLLPGREVEKAKKECSMKEGKEEGPKTEDMCKGPQSPWSDPSLWAYCHQIQQSTTQEDSVEWALLAGSSG